MAVDVGVGAVATLNDSPNLCIANRVTRYGVIDFIVTSDGSLVLPWYNYGDFVSAGASAGASSQDSAGNATVQGNMSAEAQISMPFEEGGYRLSPGQQATFSFTGTIPAGFRPFGDDAEPSAYWLSYLGFIPGEQYGIWASGSEGARAFANVTATGSIPTNRTNSTNVTSSGGQGSVKGTVVVGPLCPVESQKDSDVMPVQSIHCYSYNYSDLTVVLSGNIGYGTCAIGVKCARIYDIPVVNDVTYGSFGANGIAAGIYTVTVSPCPFYCNGVYDRTVDIVANQTTVLNLTVDTGIRTPQPQ